MTDYYDRNGNPLPGDWLSNKAICNSNTTDHRVARTVVGGIDVSTVWLGLDHSHHGGAPIIFETMTFGEPWNNECQRYTDEEQAIRGHLTVLNRLRNGKPPFSYLDDPEHD